MRKTVVRPWTSDWYFLFQQEEKLLNGIFQEDVRQTYHIGSTSVPAIGFAKPIIDIAVAVSNIELVDRYNEEMRAAGYEVRGEHGIAGRRYFTKGQDERTHHVHIYEIGHENLHKHLRFKQYLLGHPEEAKQYGELKHELAKQFPHDTHLYQKGKEAVIDTLIEKALNWPVVKKAYGYITRISKQHHEILIFEHPMKEAGIQIPKGTVEHNEMPLDAVKREMAEETGLTQFNDVTLIAEDYWENDDGKLHHRYFYKLDVDCLTDSWNFKPTGGGEEDGLVFRLFWVSSASDVELIRGHTDYFHKIFV